MDAASFAAFHRIPLMISFDCVSESIEDVRIAPVTRLQFEIIGTPSGSSMNVSVASFMPFKNTSTADRSSCRSNFRLLIAASFS